ncbi:MAG: hypothetical protein AMJ53_04255 [Gammaproteobacteria bacterium SG8_11]|nr:MAG: hypothetical protein AMJ53_04255 [Gammaproteobacteria bacterium SG8_11]
MAGNYTVLRVWVQWMCAQGAEMQDKADISINIKRIVINHKGTKCTKKNTNNFFTLRVLRGYK